MIEAVLEGIYKIEVPLPLPVVGSMNCYVLTDKKRSLVVDPGMAHSLCFGAVAAGLYEIGVNLEKTDFFITHHHLDHFGLISKIMRNGSAIYINRVEAAVIEKIASRAIQPILSRFLEVVGFPENNPAQVLSEMLGEEYRARNPWPFRYLEDGDVLEKGGRVFKCIVTPGHSPGHACLYQSDMGILISGDVFSPVVQFFSETDNPLLGQLTSFEGLERLNPRRILPGHGNVFTNLKRKTEQLKAHHRARNESIAAVLAYGSMDSFQVATELLPSMSPSKDWEALPIILKFLAVRDCFAHLLYMEAEGQVRKKKKAERMIFSLKYNTSQKRVVA